MGKAAPPSQGQGLAVASSFLTYVAAVVEVAATGKRIRRLPILDQLKA